MATTRSILGRVAGGLTFALALLTAGAAFAGGCGCSPPPPCCAPPTPPTPPSYPCCQPPGHVVNVPGVTVNVAASVVVNANVSAQVGAYAGGQASGQSSVYYSGGYSGSYVGPGVGSVVQTLNVDGGGGIRRGAYEASRTKITKVVIQANCIDDKDIPHPASQVSPDRDISDGYEGELYRCIAGTHMQYVWAEYTGKIAFDHGQTVNCAKAEALWRSPGGQVQCRPQKPARDCNERSLLRRFGAGVKILTMITIERYTDYHEEAAQAGASTSLSLDGGVGGMVY
ncbi:MAG TPA: hypothetical protein VGI79_18970 [Caulobacteraceae bacterium]